MLIGGAALFGFVVTLGKLLAWLFVVTLAASIARKVFGPVPVLVRLLASCWAIWRALDILGCAIWLGLLFVFGLADKPTGRRMISSYIGFAAHNGHRWALVAQSAIDWAAMRLGDKPRHCERAWRHYAGLDG